jgi:hypothetical protein|tara:strand:- start:4337 stop:4579 length:243 start_codon:yes stop_codon:yes gene_type:complete
MKTAWFKGCKTKKDKESVTQVLQSNRESLDRLKEILEPLLKDSNPASDYDSPSWAYKQADRNGFNRAVTTVLDLINLDKE